MDNIDAALISIDNAEVAINDTLYFLKDNDTEFVLKVKSAKKLLGDLWAELKEIQEGLK